MQSTTTHSDFHTGGLFNPGLTDDVKIAVASSVTAFIVGSILFFIIGFLCGHFYRWEKKITAGAITEPEKIHAPYYDDIVLKQQQHWWRKTVGIGRGALDIHWCTNLR